MNFKPLVVIVCAGLSACFLVASGQDTLLSKIARQKDSIIDYNKLVTIAYDIKVINDKNKPGIEETYNGGIKTIFVDNEKARIRLVTLMRIQSIFFSFPVSAKPISIVKESGKKRYKYRLTNEEWDSYNSKYDGDSCQFTNDSAVILNYPCRKAIILLKDGRSLVAYYTNQLKPLDKKIEPAFSCIPGLVLQYEYEYKKSTLVFTANKISQNNITPSIFKIPGAGYPVKKFCIKCSAKKAAISENSAID